VFDHIDGGAECEVTLTQNREGFDDISLLPRALMHVTQPDLATSVCGIRLGLPFICAPTGLVGAAHPDGELAASIAAPEIGAKALVSTHATYSLEELALGAPEMPWFQLYPPADRDFCTALLERALVTKVPLLAVTVDVPVPGNRERDVAHRYSIPPKVTPKNAWSVMSHPTWALRLVRNPRIFPKNFVGGSDRVRYREVIPLLRKSMGAMSPRVDWDDLDWLRSQWPGPLLVKGILRSEDARRAVDAGVDGIVVSNHGGRQLDGVPASIRVLPSIVESVGSDVDVLLDSGVRRGTDIVKALCLGAKACLVGRPWVYGLAAGGTEGVRAVLGVLRDELVRTMVLLGCSSVKELSPEYLWTSSK
jgi:isopentenyl diphosphate isomerase/L-lactate dehydrogenase-like FMN-dependent dehydrogenase